MKQICFIWSILNKVLSSSSKGYPEDKEDPEEVDGDEGLSEEGDGEHAEDGDGACEEVGQGAKDCSAKKLDTLEIYFFNVFSFLKQHNFSLQGN